MRAGIGWGEWHSAPGKLFRCMREGGREGGGTEGWADLQSCSTALVMPSQLLGVELVCLLSWSLVG